MEPQKHSKFNDNYGQMLQTFGEKQDPSSLDVKRNMFQQSNAFLAQNTQHIDEDAEKIMTQVECHDECEHTGSDDDVEDECEDDKESHPIGYKNSLKDPEEYKHLRAICSAFFNYQVDSLRDVTRMERDFNSIKEEYKARLKFNYLNRLDKIRSAIWQNYLFLLKIVQPYSSMFKFFKTEKNEILIEPLFVPPKDVIKMRSTVKLFIRDWSQEGERERSLCYGPIIEEFKKFYPSNKHNDGSLISVLLPGAGLGRLLYEFAKLGYKAQGNEFSYFMLLSSNFILNCTTKQNEYEIQPLIHSFSNAFGEDAPFKKISIPDENLLEELKKNNEGEMSMVAGEFVHVYKKQIMQWDSVVTCFFLDTANNIIEYIETIANILKTGGLWINIGPLLYHYTEIETECSIELSWEELRHIIINYGFQIKAEEVKECMYSSDGDSMIQTIYRCIFFTAVKSQEVINI